MNATPLAGETQKKRSRWRTILIIAGMAILGCCGFTAIVALLGGGDQTAVSPTTSVEVAVNTTPQPTNTPRQTYTSQPTDAQRTTASNAAGSPSQEAATSSSSDADAPLSQQTKQATVNRNANLRSGPGTDYPVIGSATQGDVIELVARNSEGDWYQLVTGAWIAGFLVDTTPDGLPVATDSDAGAAEPAARISRGLGLSRAQWEQEHSPDNVLSASDAYYDSGKFWVVYDSNEKIFILEVSLPNGADLDVARAAVRPYIPLDATFVETYTPPDSLELVVDQYRSEWLAAQYETDLFWEGRIPGTFIVSYAVYDGVVSSAIIAVGVDS